MSEDKKSKSQLHELLAVESELETRHKNAISVAKERFSKPSLFIGANKSLKLFEDTDMETPCENQHLEFTVNQVVNQALSHTENYLNAVYQKEASNQNATADIEVDGKIICENLPATFLLGLETKLKLVRELFQNIPILQQGIEWEKDEQVGEDIYKTTHPEKKYKTRRTFRHKVLYEATKEHPAQIEKWEESENIGIYTTELISGMLSVADKTNYLDRIDKLIQAVKSARMRANQVEVVKNKVAYKLINYILG